MCELGLPGHTYLSVSNAFCSPTVSQYTSLSIGKNSSPPVEDSMLQCQLILANTDGQKKWNQSWTVFGKLGRENVEITS